MTWLPVAITLLCACAHDVIAIMHGAFPGMPMGALGGLGGFGGFGPGLSGFTQNFEEEEESGRVLTCSNRELGANNRVIFAVAATIKEEPNSRLEGFGGFNMGHMGSQRQEPNNVLSAQIQVINNVDSGQGIVAFTTRAQPENLCALNGNAQFGSNLVRTEDSNDLTFHSPYSFGHGMGFGGMGMGMGMGLGMSPGFGFGMGPLSGMSFDDDDDDDNDDNDEEAGVVTRIPITRGSVSTMSIDALPFKSLKELAGRGLVICSNVRQDDNGQYVCQKPFYACCQLRFDDRSVSLQTTV